MKNYNTFLFVFIVSICFSLTTTAQEVNADNPSAPSFWERVRFGGGFGINFGDGFFSGSLSPNAIYQFNQYVGAGIGLNGIYASEKDLYTATVLGGSVIGIFNPVREVQLSSEFEMLNVNRNFEDFLGIEDQNYWYPALFLGAGYNTGFMIIGFRYDVLYDADESIYGNAFVPFVRFYF